MLCGTINHRFAPLVFAFALATSGCADDTGRIEVFISGEELATEGFRFPVGSEVTLADGWEIQFDHVLVTVGNITLSENPDKDPTDQSQTDAVVAELAGPWAVDLHKDGPVPAAGGEGTAIPIVTIESQNQNDNAPLPSGPRYAFSYDLVAAAEEATKVNFEGDADAEAAYVEMIAGGYTVFYTGTATFKGTGCDVSDSAYDFTMIPATVAFRLGFRSPASFINCQNQDNQGDAFEHEAYQRGVATPANRPARAQMTIHVEHAFYSGVGHEPALFFTQMAAQLAGKPAGAVLTIDDLIGVDPIAFNDAAGAALPWRICNGSTPPAGQQMGFDVGSVPVNPSAHPADALRDYRDYVHYVQSAQGHFNGGEGICYVKRNYSSPL